MHSDAHVLEFGTVADGPAQAAFDLIADAARWPQHFSRTVHTEYLSRADGRDTIQVWGLLRGRDAVRTWTSERVLDRAALTIAFSNQPAVPPVADGGGQWSFVRQPGGSVKITVRHEFRLVVEVPEAVRRVSEELARHSEHQLAELKAAVERADELNEEILEFEDPLFIAGSAQDAYQVLYEADKWPERLAHVAKLEMTEEVPNIQFFDMDTTTSDGRAHTTRSVRICLPANKIVYKQLATPPLLRAHTGHWTFTPTPEGLIAGARHTVTIDRGRLSLLGPDTTVADARRYLRRVLSANSMTNLRLAKTYAEEHASV